MKDAVSATEASRKFSQLLRLVRKGRTFVVTLHDQPVARIVPIGEDTDDRVRSAAREILLSRLGSQPVLNVGRWARDRLYEE